MKLIYKVQIKTILTFTTIFYYTDPRHWGEQYSTCIGKHQSPINIEDHDVKNVTLPLLSFYGLNSPRDFILENNGHTGKQALKLKNYVR